MRVLFEVLLLIIIALFAYKAFVWIFPSKKTNKKEISEIKNVIEGEIEPVTNTTLEDKEETK